MDTDTAATTLTFIVTDTRLSDLGMVMDIMATRITVMVMDSVTDLVAITNRKADLLDTTIHDLERRDV